MIPEVRLQRGSEQLAEDRDVEGDRFLIRLDRGFQRLRRFVREPGEGALDRGVPTLAPNVSRHRPMDRSADARGVQATKQITGIAVAEINLVCRRAAEPPEHVLRNPARSVAAAGEPDGVEAGIVGGLHERIGARFVGTGKMIAAEEALGMEFHLQPRELRRKRSDAGRRSHP
jgi:hypothetical protein